MPPRKADPPADSPKPKKPRKRRPKVKFPKFILPRAAGRPVLYDGPAHCARAKRLALLGLTDNEIAFQFGINPDTLYDWATKYPDFSESLKEGKTEADSFVADSMYARACGTATFPAVKIFMPAGADKPVYASYTERALPDVNAGFRWLYNRQPDRWRERKQVDVTGSLEHRISLMTPEQRRARLIELQAKAAQIIEGEATEVDDETEA